MVSSDLFFPVFVSCLFFVLFLVFLRFVDCFLVLDVAGNQPEVNGWTTQKQAKQKMTSALTKRFSNGLV